ncbi:MAG: ATP/GTP-binding protein [Xanthomonadales bacterium]|nr:ATP/GTP-binding protein [Xanthomonadales bacterium]
MAGNEHKLIVSGCIGAGKTTAISQLSKIRVVSTEAQNNDIQNSSKAQTTVAMDYGELSLDNGDRLRLYGTPGQKRFDYMWKVMAPGSLGVILLLDNQRKQVLEELQEYLAVFQSFIQEQRMVIGVVRSNEYHYPSVGDYYAYLRSVQLQAPVFSIDARRRSDIVLLINALLSQIEMKIKLQARSVS